MNFYLHLGYPKTATTTLQQEIFSDMNKHDCLYIGKTNVKKWNYNKFEKISDDLLFSHYESDKTFLNREITDLSIWIKKHKRVFKGIILSQENFLYSFNTYNYEHIDDVSLAVYENTFKNIKYFLEMLSIELNTKFKLCILVTIRNQSDALYSHYCHAVKTIDIETYLYRCFNDENYSIMPLLKYDEVIRKIIDIMNPKIMEIKIYEDLVNNHVEYFNSILKFINSNAIFPLENTFYNNKKTISEGSKRNVYKISIGAILAYIKSFIPFFRNIPLSRIIIFRKIIYKLNSSGIGYTEVIPHFDFDTMTQIKKIFHNSNKSLERKYNLNLSRISYFNDVS